MSKLARCSALMLFRPTAALLRTTRIQVVDHAVKYVNIRVHANVLENFWSLLNRGISGTYVSVEPFHLFRYLDEQTFRSNNRKNKDA